MAASSGARRPLAFVEDTAVAPERLNDYVAAFKEILDRHGLNAGWYGHCSVGCLHIRPFVDLTEPGGIETMGAVAEEIVDLVAAFDGVNSSEHGDGRVRSAFNRRIFGDELYDAFREVKALFDPQNRLNPGVMVEAAPLTEDLRDPALPPPGPIETHLHFPDGMRAAADRCQRIGACRKTGIGVMCPSYMATREEEHATRGRANALVKALSEPDPKQALGDERLHEILDLCLECKACKSECPLSVDMASLKAEFLSHYQDAHGVPLRSRLFGSIRALNRIGAATAPLSNLAPRRLLERAAGIDRRRPLPRFQRDTLIRWDKQRTKLSGREVVFLADSFTTFTEPAIGRAAIELLEAAGYAVRLEAAGCCGRSSISKGLLDRARAMAESMTERLAPYAERGVPIVGCEPSCLLTLKEEHLSLQPGNARAQTVADHARLVEELLSRRSTTARCSSTRAPRWRAAGSSSTATAIRRRWPAPRPPWNCSSGFPAPRWSSSTPAAAGWPGRSGSRRSTTSFRCRSVNCGCSRRCAGRPPALWSPRPGSHAASRSRTGWGGRQGTRCRS